MPPATQFLNLTTADKARIGDLLLKPISSRTRKLLKEVLVASSGAHGVIDRRKRSRLIGRYGNRATLDKFFQSASLEAELTANRSQIAEEIVSSSLERVAKRLGVAPANLRRMAERIGHPISRAQDREFTSMGLIESFPEDGALATLAGCWVDRGACVSCLAVYGGDSFLNRFRKAKKSSVDELPQWTTTSVDDVLAKTLFASLHDATILSLGRSKSRAARKAWERQIRKRFKGWKFFFVKEQLELNDGLQIEKIIYRLRNRMGGMSIVPNIRSWVVRMEREKEVGEWISSPEEARFAEKIVRLGTIHWARQGHVFTISEAVARDLLARNHTWRRMSPFSARVERPDESAVFFSAFPDTLRAFPQPIAKQSGGRLRRLSVLRRSVKEFGEFSAAFFVDGIDVPKNAREFFTDASWLRRKAGKESRLIPEGRGWRCCVTPRRLVFPATEPSLAGGKVSPAVKVSRRVKARISEPRRGKWDGAFIALIFEGQDILRGFGIAFAQDCYADIVDGIGSWQEQSLRMIGGGVIESTVLPQFNDWSMEWSCEDWVRHLAKRSPPESGKFSAETFSEAIGQFWPGRPSFQSDWRKFTITPFTKNFCNIFRELDSDFLLSNMSAPSRRTATALSKEWQAAVAFGLEWITRKSQNEFCDGRVESQMGVIVGSVGDEVADEILLHAKRRILLYESKIVRRVVESITRQILNGNLSPSLVVAVSALDLRNRLLVLARRHWKVVLKESQRRDSNIDVERFGRADRFFDEDPDQYDGHDEDLIYDSASGRKNPA